MMREAFPECKRLAVLAGKRIMEIYSQKNISVTEKVEDGRSSPVTEADIAANTIIVSGLRKAFPDCGILTEEEKDSSARLDKEWCFIIDPLDGTKEFCKRNGEFTINIGLVRNHRPVMGVIYVPEKDYLFYGSPEGAFLEKSGSKQKISVSHESDPKKMKVVVSRSHPSDKLSAFIRKMGFSGSIPAGSSLKGCLVASGEADFYPRLGPQHEWDFCAMDAIISAAGGKMTDILGKPILYNQVDTLRHGFLASNASPAHEIAVFAAKSVL